MECLNLNIKNSYLIKKFKPAFYRADFNHSAIEHTHLPPFMTLTVHPILNPIPSCKHTRKNASSDLHVRWGIAEVPTVIMRELCGTNI